MKKSAYERLEEIEGTEGSFTDRQLRRMRRLLRDVADKTYERALQDFRYSNYNDVEMVDVSYPDLKKVGSICDILHGQKKRGGK